MTEPIDPEILCHIPGQTYHQCLQVYHEHGKTTSYSRTQGNIQISHNDHVFCFIFEKKNLFTICFKITCG